MGSTINPETLKKLRDYHGLTQEQLANRIAASGRSNCNEAAISRWERGKNTRLTSHKREQLARALSTDWETLTKPIDLPEEEQRDAVSRDQMNVRVKNTTKTALELVCNRFNVKPPTVIDLAPLLFLITAENSLLARKRRLKAARSLLFDAENAALPHLGKYVFYSPWGDGEIAEEKSIAKRDIFFTEALEEDWDVFGDLWDDCDCPYTHYLQELADELIEEGNAVAKITPHSRAAPEYEIALDTFCELTGIDDSKERGLDLRSLIMNRYIDLAVVIDKRKDLSEDEYQKWLDVEFDEAKKRRSEDDLKAMKLMGKAMKREIDSLTDDQKREFFKDLGVVNEKLEDE